MVRESSRRSGDGVEKRRKKYLTDTKDFDRISELLRKRQSNAAWYDLRSSKELRKKFKKYLTSTKRCAKITKPMRMANGTNGKMNLDN